MKKGKKLKFLSNALFEDQFKSLSLREPNYSIISEKDFTVQLRKVTAVMITIYNYIYMFSKCHL